MYKERLRNDEVSSNTAVKDIGGCNREPMPCHFERGRASNCGGRDGAEEKNGQLRRKRSSSSETTEELQATYMEWDSQWLLRLHFTTSTQTLQLHVQLPQHESRVALQLLLLLHPVQNL